MHAVEEEEVKHLMDLHFTCGKLLVKIKIQLLCGLYITCGPRTVDPRKGVDDKGLMAKIEPANRYCHSMIL